MDDHRKNKPKMGPISRPKMVQILCFIPKNVRKRNNVMEVCFLNLNYIENTVIQHIME